MTLLIVTQRLCDGCAEDDSKVEIVETVKFWFGFVHLCYGCRELGKIICRDCRDVHDAGACRYQQVMKAARDRRSVAPVVH